MSDYYEATGRLSTSSFLFKPQWNTQSMKAETATLMDSHQGTGVFECTQAGIKGVPHMPSLGNGHHGIGGFIPLSQRTQRFRADNCACCGQRIVNYTPKHEVARPNGWRLLEGLAPEFLIQEEPW